jgi:hypothetical protein
MRSPPPAGNFPDAPARFIDPHFFDCADENTVDLAEHDSGGRPSRPLTTA